MQVTPASHQLTRLSGRWGGGSSAGNDNKSRVAKCAVRAACPTPQDSGVRTGGGEELPKRRERGAERKSRCLVSPVLWIFLMPRCVRYPRGGRWPVTERRRPDSSLLPESEGSAQLWTAGLSV